MTNDSDSIATLRLLAKCGSMDLSMLGPIADEIAQLRAAVKTAQELAATRLMEIERLKDALKRVRRVAAEGTTHTGMIAALGILVDRTLNPGNGPLPPDYTYHSHEPSEPRTDHAENLAKALEHYLKAHDTLSAAQDTDEVSGTNEASDCGLHDTANDAWRAMRTALYEYRKHGRKAAVSLPACECLLRDKAPSAYHAPKCPAYVADLL